MMTISMAPMLKQIAPADMSPTLRADYIGKSCTLDGKPATIVGTGRLEKFAMVRTEDGTKQAEFAWSAVWLVMRCGRNFRAW
jgi:hypothetical protein